MEKFNNLSLEKQDTIINAALDTFGANGYKKTSVSDIANAAGVSKAMIFHYFNTKRDLYFYLLNFCMDLIMEEINEKYDTGITDFFDRIKMATTLKVAVLKKHPASLSYLNSVYYESNEEVKDEIAAMMSRGDALKSRYVFDGLDYSKFKEGVDVKLVLKMLMWISEGFVNPSKSLKADDLETVCNDFYESMNLLKNNLYKEEYH